MIRPFRKDYFEFPVSHFYNVHFIVLLILPLLAYKHSFCKNQYSSEETKPVVLTNWEYYESKNTPDSPKGVLRTADWVSVNSPKDIPEVKAGNTVWIRTKLPQWNGVSPALYTGQIDFFFQVYLNDRLIYQPGDSLLLADLKFLGRNQNLIGLPYFKQGDIITFRIKPARDYAGFHGKVLLASSDEIVKELFDRNIHRLFFAALSFVTGIVCLIIFFRTCFPGREARRLYLLLGIAVFLIPNTFFILSNSLFLQLIYPAPSLYNHVNFISLVLATIGGLLSIEHIIKSRRRIILRYLWYLNFLILIVSILLNHYTEILYLDILPYFLIVTATDMLICLIIIIRERKGNYEIKILIAGLLTFFLFANLEILLYFTIGLYTDFGYNIRSLYIGVAAFVVSLIWIVIYRYLNTVRQKEAYQQKELEAVQRENEARQQFAVNLIESQENERNRIALELHDSVGQKLLLIKNQLLLSLQTRIDDNTAQSMKDITNLTGDAIQEIRSITYNLRPQYLDQIGLTAAIETLVEEVCNLSNIEFQVHIEDIDNLLPKSHEINFFRIVQESLNNIVKHSGAARAFINICKNNDEIYMAIKDDGKGCKNKRKSKSDTRGLGITGMRERAGMIGANLCIDITENVGTVIMLKYNVNQNS